MGKTLSNHTVNAASLFLVATPIGNLGDISSRALQVLAEAAWIAAEDTRHSKHLLQHYAITTRVLAYHQHNEARQTPILIDRLHQGQSIALVSDAGTPLVSDPGYRLVRAALQDNIRVVPVPGACAAIAALSASGLPTDRFVFEGFPPARQGSRLNFLKALSAEQRTLVFYVSCHRLLDTLQDMLAVFGDARQAVLARELTKAFETIRKARLDDLVEWVRGDPNQQRGEMVVLIEGASEHGDQDQEHVAKLLTVLVDELPLKQAASIASRLTGLNKNDLYKQALGLNNNKR